MPSELNGKEKSTAEPAANSKNGAVKKHEFFYSPVAEGRKKRTGIVVFDHRQYIRYGKGENSDRKSTNIMTYHLK